MSFRRLAETVKGARRPLLLAVQSHGFLYGSHGKMRRLPSWSETASGAWQASVLGKQR